MRRSPPPTPDAIRARVRVFRDRDIALGPGKADLLDAIASSGSLGQAARALGMSYARAWKLVRTMNECFALPLVLTTRGGAARGGATLTAEGLAVLRLYRRMESAGRRAMAPAGRDILRRLRN